ncbi:MAG: 50S ribosomal protein L29 [bacterium]
MNYAMENIRKKSRKDLEKDLFKKADQSRRFRFEVAGNQVKNVREIQSLKKDIARILTSLKEREGKGDNE